MTSFGIDKIADQVTTAPGGWTVVVVRPDQVPSTVEDLLFHLEILLDGEEARLSVGSLADLPTHSHGSLDVSVVIVEVADADTLRALNLARGRFLGGPRVIIVTDLGGLDVLRVAAPDLWSWVGLRVRTVDVSAGLLDVEARLASLRAAVGLTDEEVVQRAENGTLSGDPLLAEWLVLLGRGDLLAD